MADREVFESSQYGEGPSRLFPDLPQSAAFNDGDIREIRERIEEAEQRKDFGACLTLCCSAIKMEPADLNEFLIMKAMFLVRANRSDEANEALAGILVNDPENARALGALGFIFYHQGNLKKSVEVFTNALQIDSGLKNVRDLRKKSMRLIEIFNAGECNRMSCVESSLTVSTLFVSS
jgi:tetratricopeptide (TPR) repeat protein